LYLQHHLRLNTRYQDGKGERRRGRRGLEVADMANGGTLKPIESVATQVPLLL